MILHVKKYSLYYLVLLGLLVPLIILEKEVHFIIWALTSVFVVVVLFFLERIRYHQKFKALQQEKLVADLALLKSQINPHFFFNTLNNLYGLTIKNSKKAPEVILGLSEMMRYTIYKGKEELVTLEEEVNYMESFISLQEIRLVKASKVTFVKRIENPKYKIAPLLFIILVENAFKHGSEKLGKDAFVKISCQDSSTEICLEVENSFDADEKNEQGIGLDNLKKRLSLLYPNKYELNLVTKDNIYKATLKIFK